MSATTQRPKQRQQAPLEERPELDPAKLEATIKALEMLELSNPVEFSERLANTIFRSNPYETAAFRSEALAFKSLTAARYLIENTNSILRRRDRDKQKQVDTERFINLVGRERRLLENIVNGIRAREGVLPNQPNPRQRALRRLASENIKGDVPKGRFRELIEEEKQIAVDRKKAEREARKAERRAERAQAAKQAESRNRV